MSDIKEATQDFNPRLREGGDPDTRLLFSGLKDFNPRLREGGDQKEQKKKCWIFYFNPRLREGGDLIPPDLFRRGKISIHASAKEATATYCDTSAIMYISSLNNFFIHYF